MPPDVVFECRAFTAVYAMRALMRLRVSLFRHAREGADDVDVYARFDDEVVVAEEI